ncbi:YqjF family protein [Paenibacillus piri]|uniref:DUF2071 domain-containing protein n=1 Tax=Paenibacillus piri TaxID=2547395 RepID=A0A4R5KSV5_9BACL|nr:DUF2071 domain-containing protein [Paenibacillus piri]TDF98138.1 DUF2071 domain-containing protein [Paenibacillus piri]
MNPLKVTAHRPWKLPERLWVMKQRWLDLLFAHWPVRYDELRQLVPPGLELDIFDGYAWIGIVPFRMERIRLRGLPPIPFANAFAELNVRTYVTMGDKPGVYFFSLDAAHRLAVMAARRFVYLPYFYADMRVNRRQTGHIDYSSHRRDGRGAAVSLEAAYAPASPQFVSTPHSMEHWLTERYGLYTFDRQGTIWRGDIHHLPWNLQSAEAEFRHNSMASGQGIRLMKSKPLLHFSHMQDVWIWPLVKAEISS